MTQKLTAIIILTVREAVRKKTFVILAIFAAALISSSAFFPVLDKNSQLKLVEQWTIRAIILFATLTAVFLTGASLPSDIEEKRIQTLISKPINKLTIIMGKFLGFAAVTAISVALMGVIGYLYIRVVHASGGGDLPALEANQRMLTEDIGMEHAIQEPNADEVRFISIGEARGVFTWRFAGLDRDRFAEMFPCRFRLGIITNWKFAGNVLVKAQNPSTGRSLESKFLIRSNTPGEMNIPRDLIDDNGEIVISIAKAEPQSHLTAYPDGVSLLAEDAGFEIAYICGMIVIFAQTMIVTTATLMASTFLSTPVSIFVGFFVFFCGGMYGFTDESLKTSERMMKRMDEMRTKNERVRRMPNEIDPTVIKISNAASRAALSVLPDFRRFDYAPSLLNNNDLPRGAVPGAFLYSAQYVALFILLGALVLSSKDLG